MNRIDSIKTAAASISANNAEPASVAEARAAYAVLCDAIGTDVTAEENAILSIGREFLPPSALAVLDGGPATVEYFEFLTSQTEAAQAESDAEYQASHT